MLKKITFLVSLFVALISFMSATAPVEQPASINANSQVELEKAIKEGKTAKFIEQQTGEKLTLKEKAAIKIAEKKVKKELSKEQANGDKSQVTALILVVLIGGLGIHRFYLGYTWQGVVQLLTAGGCGIWSLIDLIRIITGDLKPKDGDYAKKL